MEKYPFIPYSTFEEFPHDQMIERSKLYLEEMRRRRTTRHFSTRDVPREVIENCVSTAGTAPSGANMQPWHFAIVSDPVIKKKIRVEAEKVEDEFYNRRAPQYWLDALAHLGTDEHKPYLEEAPYLIVIFSVRNHKREDGETEKHYYVSESTGIATGMLITAVHHAGLACLTHTPSPMAFLRDVLGRPKEETPFLLLTVGYPADDARVPDISKKPLSEIATFL